MKVLYLSIGDDKYGAPKSMMELVGNLMNRHNVEPIILTCSDGLINKWCKENGIECYTLNYPAFMIVGGSNFKRKIIKRSMYPIFRLKYLIELKKARLEIEKILKNKNIDIVHTNINRIDLGAYFAKKHNIPHILHFREFGDIDYNCMSLRNDTIKFLNDNTTSFVAISNIVKNSWIDKGIAKEKISVIYNGIDFFKFNKVPLRIGKKNNKIKIVFVGSICETKGQIFLIKAIKELPISFTNRIQVDFYGSGRPSYIKKLQNYIKANNLQSYFCFKGYCSNIPEKLVEYDIGIVSSRAEAFGRVTVEYMAAGLCVVASNTGANPEIIDDNRNGIIFEYGNPKSLSDKLMILLNNPEIIEKIRKEAYLTVKNKYSMDICSDNIYNLYKKILEE